MSAAAAAAPDASAPAKPKSKKLLFILIGVIVLALAGGGGAFFLMKKKAAEEAEGEDGHEAEVVEKGKDGDKAPPTFLPLENMVVNLADAGGARFVQLGITLQLQDAKTSEDVKLYMPSIRSQVLLLISQYTADEILQVSGKEKLTKAIIAEISNQMGYELEEPEEEEVEQEAKQEKVKEKKSKKKRRKVPPNPVQAVLFSSFVVQ